jgi:hypothetical protein
VIAWVPPRSGNATASNVIIGRVASNVATLTWLAEADRIEIGKFSLNTAPVLAVNVGKGMSTSTSPVFPTVICSIVGESNLK